MPKRPHMLLAGLFILLTANVLSQPLFGSYYSNAPGSNTYVYSKIVTCPDGSVIGYGQGNDIYSFSLFRVDPSGNILWRKFISTGNLEIITPTDIELLKDSTVGVFFDFPLNGFCIVKCDFSGNVAWMKKYKPYMLGSALDLEALNNGGVVANTGTSLFFIRGDGTVDTVLFMMDTVQYDRSIADVENMGGDVIRAFGFTQNPHEFFLFDIDSNAMITNNYTFTMTTDSLSNVMIMPYQYIDRTPSGRTCCILSLNSQPPRYGVFQFDSVSQHIWSKKVLYDHPIRNIIATGDEGCVTTAGVVMKFDSAGAMKWLKFPGDYNQPLQNYEDILSITGDAGTGFYSILSCQNNMNLHLFHTDSVFNGFCAYQPGNAPISNLNVTQGPLSIQAIGYHINDSTIIPIQTSASWYRYDVCTGTLLDSITWINETPASSLNFSVYPNPVKDQLTLAFSENITEGTLTLYNVHGLKIREEKLHGQAVVQWNFEMLSTGIYVVCLQNGKNLSVEKIMVIR